MQKSPKTRNHSSSHQPKPWGVIVQEHHGRVTPAKTVVRPEVWVESVKAVVFAYICDAGVGQLAVPLVLDASDLAVLVEDVDLAVDGGLFADALDFVESAHVQLNGVAGGEDAVGFALDLGEGALQAVL